LGEKAVFLLFKLRPKIRVKVKTAQLYFVLKSHFIGEDGIFPDEGYSVVFL
jgi:hypothetical protein